MKIFPAIDIQGGHVVRLTQGDFGRTVVYSENPRKVASQFAARGAENLHIVDLDGARDGDLINFKSILDIIDTGNLFVQVGGGIRDEKRIDLYLQLGVDRVILGTAAVTDFSLVERMVAKHGEKIAVGVDSRDGLVAIRGWEESTDVPALEFCKRLEGAGVKTIIYTDIGKDGLLDGTNMEVYRALSPLKLDIVASGGITFKEEILELKAMGIYGAIVGKALYVGTLDLKQIIDLADRRKGKLR